MQWLQSDLPSTWQSLFYQKPFRVILRRITRKLSKFNLDKSFPSKVFRAFTYFEIPETRVIILGQDPYPNPNDASGLAFSSDGKKTPPSLRVIYRCLCHQRLIQKMPTSPNLENWAKQGILLLNRCLTKSPKETHAPWIEFTDYLLYVLSEIPWDHPVYLCLWGKSAQEVKVLSNPQLKVLKWGHPSPANTQNNSSDNPRSFLNCNHFTLIKKEYPDLCW